MQTGLFARLHIITTSCWVKCINFNISEEKWMQICGITAENICTELGHLFYLQDAKSHFLDSYCSISFGKVFGNNEKLVGNLISIRHRNGDGKNISVKKFHWLKKSCYQIPRKLFHSFFFSNLFLVRLFVFFLVVGFLCVVGCGWDDGGLWVGWWGGERGEGWDD